MFNFYRTKIAKYSKKGFVLPFSMLIATLVLLVMSSSMTLLSKQIYFSKLYRESQAAYYAADDALSCAEVIDDTYVAEDGLGIFPSSSSTDPVLPEDYIDNVITYVNTRRREDNPAYVDVTRSTIKCGQTSIFDSSAKFSVATTTFVYHSKNSGNEEGRTSSFYMHMDLGIDPTDLLGVRHIYRCAQVTVNKTPSFRQIISQGYSNCSGSISAVERAVVSTSVSE